MAIEYGDILSRNLSRTGKEERGWSLVKRIVTVVMVKLSLKRQVRLKMLEQEKYSHVPKKGQHRR